MTIEPYDQGKAACVTGKLLKDNPHERGTPKYTEWNRGFVEQAQSEARAARLTKPA